MTTLRISVAIASLALGLASCGGSPDLNSTLPEATSGNGNGTAVYSVQVLSPLRIADSSTGGQIGFSFIVTSTAANDTAVVTAAVNGGLATQVGLILPTDFAKGIGAKTASFSCTLGVEYGHASVQFCFIQSGINGRLSKATCIPTIEADACKTGTGNCDNNNSNGCETDITVGNPDGLGNIKDCGACGVTCASSQICTAGACTDMPVVAASVPVDGGTPPAAPVCPIGWASCGNDPNGCETAIHTDENCGFCGDVCDSNSKCAQNTDGSYSCNGSSS
jgi:hypothetical protein